MTVNLTIPAEGLYSDVERDWIDSEPPGLFPEDQNSYWGQVRKVFADYLQVQVDLIGQWWVNLDPSSVDANDIHNYENEVGLPNAEMSTLEQRRLSVIARRKQGAFTRTQRREIVESFIIDTFGATPQFDPAGLAFDSSGIKFFSGSTSLSGTYNIVENIPAYSYDVRILNTITINTLGLTRELQRVTPDGISFTITSTATP